MAAFPSQFSKLSLNEQSAVEELNYNLNKVLQNMAISSSDQKSRVKTIENFLENYLVPSMRKNDGLFDKLYHSFAIAGSYKDKLRITEEADFDFDIDLVLPFKSDMIAIQEGVGVPGYLSYTLQYPITSTYYKPNATLCVSQYDTLKCIQEKRLFDQDRYLSYKKLLSWFESVVQKGLYQLPRQIAVKITAKKSGPATAFQIELGGRKINLDLVPALAFRNEWPPGSFEFPKHLRFMEPKMGELRAYRIIPKPPPYSADTDHLFRVSLYELESRLMKDKCFGVFKPLLRIFKRLRDIEGWREIASYHIKILFMKELVRENYDTRNWKDDNLAMRFKQILGALREAMWNGKLPSLFYKDHDNLWEKIPREKLREYVNKVDKITRLIVIENDPKAVLQYFLTDSERKRIGDK